MFGRRKKDEGIASESIGDFIEGLCSEMQIPDGDAASGVAAAIGVATAKKAAANTHRSQDKKSGASKKADEVAKSMHPDKLISVTDVDASVYYREICIWKNMELSAVQKAERIVECEKEIFDARKDIFERCHKNVMLIDGFLEDCHETFIADAKVGIHVLAGAARGAYEKAIEYKAFPEEDKVRFQGMLKEIRAVEDKIIWGESD